MAILMYSGPGGWNTSLLINDLLEGLKHELGISDAERNVYNAY